MFSIVFQNIKNFLRITTKLFFLVSRVVFLNLPQLFFKQLLLTINKHLLLSKAYRSLPPSFFYFPSRVLSRLCPISRLLTLVTAIMISQLVLTSVANDFLRQLWTLFFYPCYLLSSVKSLH